MILISVFIYFSVFYQNEIKQKPICDEKLNIEIVRIHRFLYYIDSEGVMQRVKSSDIDRFEKIEVHSKPRRGFVSLKIFKKERSECVLGITSSLTFDPRYNCSLPICPPRATASLNKSIYAAGTGNFCLSPEVYQECKNDEKEILPSEALDSKKINTDEKINNTKRTTPSLKSKSNSEPISKNTKYETKTNTNGYGINIDDILYYSRDSFGFFSNYYTPEDGSFAIFIIKSAGQHRFGRNKSNEYLIQPLIRGNTRVFTELKAPEADIEEIAVISVNISDEIFIEIPDIVSGLHLLEKTINEEQSVIDQISKLNLLGFPVRGFTYVKINKKALEPEISSTKG